MVEQLAVGDMVMRDEYGRLGVIHVAPPENPRTARAFDTRPRSGQGAFAQEWEPALDVEPLPEVVEDVIEHGVEEIPEFRPAIEASAIEAGAIEDGQVEEVEHHRTDDSTDLFARLEASLDLDLDHGGSIDAEPAEDHGQGDDRDHDRRQDHDGDRGRRLDLTSFVVPRD